MDFVKGQLVCSKAGRDKTRWMAVVRVEGDYLFLADGALRPLAKPKKKKKMHAAPTGTTVSVEALENDALLRREIDAFEKRQPLR